MTLDMLLQEIAIKRNELNEPVRNTEDYILERVLERSQALDELIVAYYNLVKEGNCVHA